MKNKNFKKPALVIVIAALVLGSSFIFNSPNMNGQVNKFSSYEELKNFIAANSGSSSYMRTSGSTAPMAVAESASSTKDTQSSTTDYSTTNIQVAGVDEADIVKNDGKYIYMVNSSNVVIIDAYPAEQAKILSTIEFNGSVEQIFVNKERLVVFGYEYNTPYIGIASSSGAVAEKSMISSDFAPQIYRAPKTFIKVYDISDRGNPTLERNVSVDGNYYNSRMIGDYVYAITNQPVYTYGTENIPMPTISSNGKERIVSASEIYYFSIPDSSYIFTNVFAINVQNDGEELSSKTFLAGYSQSMYVSADNIYTVYNKRLNELDYFDRIVDETIIPVVPSSVKDQINEVRNSNSDKYEKMQRIGEVFKNYINSLDPEQAASVMKDYQQRAEDLQKEIAKELEKTIVYKISISNGKIEYKTSGEVPGYVLNQFSMDEYNGNFRIATTTNSWGAQSSNHVYILDENLKINGKLEDIATGERIYSVRFLGDKGYLVTLKQIDPLFVIDLSNPSDPKVLGYLKISGVSDYLHPYDETHVIGIGRDATDEGRMKGMKLSLFDVSDVSNPVEISKYIIGDRGTYSDALYDHKAFLFSKEKNILVIPVSVTEGDKWNAWQGAYAFHVDLENGFALKGKINHNQTATNANYDYMSQIRRSLYIDNVLYTISNKFVQANSLDDMSEINKIIISQESYQIMPLDVISTAKAVN